LPGIVNQFAISGAMVTGETAPNRAVISQANDRPRWAGHPPDGACRFLPLSGLNGLGSCRFLGPCRHPCVIFARAAPGRHAGRFASNPVRHIGQPLAHRWAGASRQQYTGKTCEGRFELWRRAYHGTGVGLTMWRRRCVISAGMEGRAWARVRARRQIAERSRSGVGKRRRPAIRPRGGAALV
jgi:hypothetical protein